MKKDLIKILLLTILFSIVIFFINYAFFSSSKNELEQNIAEQKYIDPSLGEDFNIIDEKISDLNSVLEKYKLNKESLSKKEIDKLKQEIKKQQAIEAEKQTKISEIKLDKNLNKFNFIYLPDDIKSSILYITDNLKTSLRTPVFNSKINDLIIEFYGEKYDTRGKMKDGKIKLFDLEKMGETETFAVFVHEFGHVIDLYFLERKSDEDISNKFYDISWDSATIMKSGQKQTDFISGYSMTNKYEDFAESFAYFVLHNSDFIKKASKSNILMNKYIFFWKYVFNNKEFFKTNFDSQKVPSYFWDTTKLDINLQNFLQYIEK